MAFISSRGFKEEKAATKGKAAKLAAQRQRDARALAAHLAALDAEIDAEDAARAAEAGRTPAADPTAARLEALERAMRPPDIMFARNASAPAGAALRYQERQMRRAERAGAARDKRAVELGLPEANARRNREQEQATAKRAAALQSLRAEYEAAVQKVEQTFREEEARSQARVDAIEAKLKVMV